MKDLTDEEKEELNRKAVAIERMLQSLYPEWERIQSKETKPEIKELMQELGRSKAVTHRKYATIFNPEEILIRLWMEEREKKTGRMSTR